MLPRAKTKIILQYDLEGNFFGIYRGLKEASEKSGLNKNGIQRCCNKDIENAYGFIWRYA